MDSPIRISFTRHVELRAQERDVDLRVVADVVFAEHARRRRNPRAADWIVRGRGIGVAYDWPASGDTALALVVTVWRE